MPTFGGHRLIATGDVDDREPVKGEDGMGSYCVADGTTVRPAVLQGIEMAVRKAVTSSSRTGHLTVPSRSTGPSTSRALAHNMQLLAHRALKAQYGDVRPERVGTLKTCRRGRTAKCEGTGLR